MSHKPGGGAASKNVNRVSMRDGAGAKRIVPAGVAQLGQRVGDHITEHGSTGYGGVNVRGPSMGAMGSVPLGNEVATNVGKGGPGTGRTNYGKSGSQCMTGAPAQGNPMPVSGKQDLTRLDWKR